ncbi:MAG: hypothetical protein SF162_05625 [bacterium]|nr:hypothetical protein [bacterium]
MSQRRPLLILIVAFVALLVITLIVQRVPPTSNLPAATPFYFRVYPDLTVDDLQVVRIQDATSGEQFTIRRTPENAWATDSGGTVVQTTADLIARTIVLLPYTQTLDLPPPEERARYGFIEGQGLLITALLNDGSSRIIAVGAFTPTGTSYFALVDDRTDLYVIERAAVDFLIVQLQNPPVAAA